jgi:ATP-dependent DNA helicase PIF1
VNRNHHLARQASSSTTATATMGAGGAGVRHAAPADYAGLSTGQAEVLRVAETGQSLFFTGAAGTGKTHILRRIIAMLDPATTAVTASTGVAAVALGGFTLHSFAGVGLGDEDVEVLVERIQKSPKAKAWRKVKTLVVDEVSMLDCALFDKIEAIARKVRQCELPFGGLQLVLCGDFYQLPPVAKGAPAGGKVYCFEARSWARSVPVEMELTQVFRQTDPAFVAALNNLRIGVCGAAEEDFFAECSNRVITPQDGIEVTKLFAVNHKVDAVNRARLAALSEAEGLDFHAADEGKSPFREMLKNCSMDALIHLRVGAQVMLVKNVDTESGLVNGVRGVVDSFTVDENPAKRLPVVRWQTKTKAGVPTTDHLTAVQRVCHEIVEQGRTVASRTQLPLRLAWALSIHRSQGATLPAVEVDLDGIFEAGQAYVALSRATTKEGLSIRNFRRNCIKSNSVVSGFHQRLRKAGGGGAPEVVDLVADDDHEG